jgi:LPXTG-site transpeptidase (sortase) family protein
MIFFGGSLMRKIYIPSIVLLAVFALLLVRPHSEVQSSLMGFTNTPLPTTAPTATNTPMPTNTPLPTPTNTPAPTAQPVRSQPTATMFLPAAGDGSQKGAFSDDVIGQLEIPTLGLELPIVIVLKDGSGWDISDLGMNVGWLENSAGLVQAGNKALIGHLDLVNSKKGPFFNLDQLKVGDEVIVTSDGFKMVYQATQIFMVDADAAQFVDIGYPSDLTLITCSKGSWDKNAHTYQKRLVVTFDLARVEQ